MTNDLSRRSVLKGMGMAAGALVVGFDLVGRSWRTKAHAAGQMEHLPPLDGVLTVDEAARAEVADDWGHIVHRMPVAVLRPGSVDDVSAMVRFCNQNGIRVVGRGRGHTVFGQAQSDGGLVIDMRTLNRVHHIGGGRAEVDAGVIWRDLIIAAFDKGWTPPVLTDFTNLTIAGTLSVGGVGGRSFRHGAQIDNVEELQVVTGAGDVVRCSRNHRRDLFEAALAGLGLCAIITRATLKLIPARARAKTLQLVYPDIPTMLGDLRTLARDHRFDFLRGTGVPGEGGFTFFIEATNFYGRDHGCDHDDDDDDRDDRDALRGLHFVAKQEFDRTYLDYVDQVNQLFDMFAGFGLNALPHPWLDLFVPSSVADDFTAKTAASIDPALFLPSSFLLWFPFVANRLKQPLFRVPDEKTFVLFDIIRTAPPDPNAVNLILGDNRRLFERNRANGGSFYTISAVPLDRNDWRTYFGPVWGLLTAAKSTYDPRNVLGGGVGIF